MSTAEWVLRGREVNVSRDPRERSLETLAAHERKYLELLADYCLLTNMEDHRPLLAGEEFSVRGVDFRLVYVPDQLPGLLGVWCDFGHLPEHREEQCCRLLLESNVARFDGRSPVMALCEETGMVLSSARLPLQMLTATALDAVLQAMAAQARAWQAEFGMH